MNTNTIIKLKKGDLTAFSDIYDGFFNLIYQFIYFKVNNKEKAEDLTSEVFLRFVDHVKKIEKDIDNVNAILYKIARNLIIDDKRKKKEELLGDEFLEDIKDETINMDDLDSKYINNEVLLEALGKLNDDYRDALVMYYINEFSVADMCDVLDKNENSIRVLLSRALSSLKKILIDKKF